MTIELLTGDMWERFGEPGTVMVLAANCAGVMGAGQVAPYPGRDPEGYGYYRALCASGSILIGRPRLIYGRCQVALAFPTMERPGERSRYDWIESGIRSWAISIQREFAYSAFGHTWLVPMLGCGIGGLDPERVAAILTEHLTPIEGHTFAIFGPRPGREGGR